MSKLAGLRQRIDAIDDSIIALIKQRLDVAEEIGSEKSTAGLPTTYDPEREERVIRRAMESAAPDVPAHAARRIFREIISLSLHRQLAQSVGFLGPRGTFSEAAARSIFGLAADYVEFATIGGVFRAVESGRT